MLSGFLVYKDSQYGELKYNLLARDSFNDLKMQLTVDDKCDYESYQYKSKLYDLDENGVVPTDLHIDIKDASIRRLDVKKTNKYKSTITNREFAMKISALIRYILHSGRMPHAANNLRSHIRQDSLFFH